MVMIISVFACYKSQFINLKKHLAFLFRKGEKITLFLHIKERTNKHRITAVQ